jgi:hypothetical protein
MAITSTTPVSPWTTGIGGTGTWDDVVTFINNPAIITKTSTSTYVIMGLLDITAVLSPLTNSIIICKGGGNYSIGSGGIVTFGKSVINVSGQTMYTDGCTIIEDTDSFARGADPYTNTKSMVRTGGTMNLYASTILTKCTSLSHFDTQSGSIFKVRSSRHHQEGAGVNSFDHYGGTIDWDGYVTTHASDTTGALLELLSTSTVVQLKGFVPYLNSASTRQATLWIQMVTLSNYGGDTYAIWNATGGYYRFPDPLTTTLNRVDNASSCAMSAAETRTLTLSCLSGVTPISGAVVTAIDNTTMVNFQATSNASGIASGSLKRKIFPGGSSWPISGITRTPHVIYARKWGYKTFSSVYSANPSSYGLSGLQAIAPLVADTNITLSSSASAAITGVTLLSHGKPVSWNGKNFSITITADSTTTSLSDVYHSIAYQNSELTTYRGRKCAYFNNAGGQRYYMVWPGASGNTDLTFVIVHKSRESNPIYGSQIAGAIGTSTAGIALRSHTTNGMVVQNYLTDIFPEGSYTANQNIHVGPDGGEQLMITIGVYTASTGKMALYSNNYYMGQQTCSITRTGTSYFSVGSFSNSSSWAVQYHKVHEQMGFDRALSAAEVTQLTYYLGNKWHFTGFGNIYPGTSVAWVPANYPVNGSGNEWTPADYATGQGPLCWIDMSSSANYVTSGSNIVSFKDLVSGNQIINNSGNYSSATVYTEGAGEQLHQLFSSLNTTQGATYADGFFRGVRVVDSSSGLAFPGITTMQSDDGTFYTPAVTYQLSLSNLIAGSEVRLFRTSDDVELAGVESSGTTFNYTYIYTTDTPCYLVVFSLNYAPIRLSITLGANNTSLPIQQVTDRVYLNQ